MHLAEGTTVKFRFIALLLINKKTKHSSLAQYNIVRVGRLDFFRPSFGTNNCLILGKSLDERVSVTSDANGCDNNNLSQKVMHSVYHTEYI